MSLCTPRLSSNLLVLVISIRLSCSVQSKNGNFYSKHVLAQRLALMEFICDATLHFKV